LIESEFTGYPYFNIYVSNESFLNRIVDSFRQGKRGENAVRLGTSLILCISEPFSLGMHFWQTIGTWISQDFRATHLRGCRPR